MPTDLLTCSGARPGKGIKRNLHHQHHLEICQKFMTLTIFFPIKVSLGVARFFEFQMAQPSPRSRHFSAAIVDKLYLWGGLGESVVTSIVHHYDPDSETWNTNTCEGPHPPGIHSGACASAGHHLYTYGGQEEEFNYQGTLHLLDTRSRRWKLISSQGGPMRKIVLRCQTPHEIFGEGVWGH